MKKYSLFLLVPTLVVLCACEKVINVDLPDHDPVLVLNGEITADSMWSISVSKSQHILEENTLDMIDSANVEVYEGTTLITKMIQVADGEYESLTSLPEVGKSYTVKVSATGYDAVEANYFYSCCNHDFGSYQAGLFFHTGWYTWRAESYFFG